MAKILTVVNQKGGVGKTTTAVNLGAFLAKEGKRVLLVDIDSQANATSGLGVDVANVPAGVYEVLIGAKQPHEVIQATQQEGYHVMPSSLNLAGANVELVPLERREFRLYDALAQLKPHYDYILIDCPPSLGLLTINGLVAGDEAFIPIQCEYYALEGLSHLLKTIELVQQNLKPTLGLHGAVLTMYDDRNRLSGAVLRQIYQYFPAHIYRTVIPRNVRLAEAPSYGKSILHYDARSKGGKAYEKLTREFLEHEAVRA